MTVLPEAARSRRISKFYWAGRRSLLRETPGILPLSTLTPGNPLTLLVSFSLECPIHILGIGCYITFLDSIFQLVI